MVGGEFHRPDSAPRRLWAAVAELVGKEAHRRLTGERMTGVRAVGGRGGGGVKRVGHRHPALAGSQPGLAGLLS